MEVDTEAAQRASLQVEEYLRRGYVSEASASAAASASAPPPSLGVPVARPTMAPHLAPEPRASEQGCQTAPNSALAEMRQQRDRAVDALAQESLARERKSMMCEDVLRFYQLSLRREVDICQGIMEQGERLSRYGRRGRQQAIEAMAPPLPVHVKKELGLPAEPAEEQAAAGVGLLPEPE